MSKKTGELVGYSYTDEMIEYIINSRNIGVSFQDIADQFNIEFKGEISKKKTPETIRGQYEKYKDIDLDEGVISRSQSSSNMKLDQPKVLIFDIETAPILAHVWGLWDQNIGLNMIERDWYIMSFAAKWLDDPKSKIMYKDQEGITPQNNDIELLESIWSLLDEADVVITQNGRKFDQKKLNARFILSGLQPPSSFKHIDTLLIAKKHFAFTSNKLAWMTDKLCVKYKKLSHGKYAGFDLWKECLKDNPKAWAEMKKYNKYDVLSLEELYNKLIPYESGMNFNLFHNKTNYVCKCGSSKFEDSGFFYTGSGKFQKQKCIKCGHETRDKKNLFSKDKKKSLRVDVSKR